MDLLEYQAKEWFREMGIPVLPSQKINCISDIKGLKIPYPVVLKSQVRTGGRGRAGGVRFVTTTIDAIAAAQTIFHLPILGEVPEIVLAEAKYDADKEFYLAVVLDTATRRPVLLGSPQGGIDVESSLELLQQVVVEREFSPFYARRLTIKMGLRGALIASVSDIIEKMYQLFLQKDLDLVEINPLGVSATGEVMALDGKVTVNNRAIARHADISLMAQKMAERGNDQNHFDNLGNAYQVEQAGNMGIMGNGAGLVMATLDLVVDAGGKVKTCLNLGHGSNLNPSSPSFGDRLEQGLEFLARDKNIHVVLVNILGSVPTALEVAENIYKFIQRHETNSAHKHRPLPYPRIIVRFWGWELESAQEQFATLGIPLLESLDEAVSQAVRQSKSSSYRR